MNEDDDDDNNDDYESSSSIVLAAKRTYRRDPLNGFRRYTGGWNIKDVHYWAVSSMIFFFCCIKFSTIFKYTTNALIFPQKIKCAQGFRFSSNIPNAMYQKCLQPPPLIIELKLFTHHISYMIKEPEASGVDCL